MRTREEIDNTLFSQLPEDMKEKGRRHGAYFRRNDDYDYVLIVELLLDIRDLLNRKD